MRTLPAAILATAYVYLRAMKGWENGGGAETTEVRLFTPPPHTHLSSHIAELKAQEVQITTAKLTEKVHFIEGRHWMHSAQPPYFCQGIFTPSDPTHKGYSCSAFPNRTLSLVVLCVQRYSGNDLPIPVQESGKKP